MTQLTSRQSDNDDDVFKLFKIDDRTVFGEGEFKELKTKIRTKERELSQLRKTTEKDVAVLTEELDSLEIEQRVCVDTKRKAEEEIRRLQEVVRIVMRISVGWNRRGRPRKV